MMFVTFLHDVCDDFICCYFLFDICSYFTSSFLIEFRIQNSHGYSLYFFTWSDLSHKLFQNIHRIVFNDSVDYNSCVNRSLYFTVPSVIPISDINDTECLKHTTQEIQLRCKVAALYRLIDLNGWSHGIFNHISVSMNNLY